MHTRLVLDFDLDMEWTGAWQFSFCLDISRRSVDGDQYCTVKPGPVQCLPVTKLRWWWGVWPPVYTQHQTLAQQPSSQWFVTKVKSYSSKCDPQEKPISRNECSSGNWQDQSLKSEKSPKKRALSLSLTIFIVTFFQTFRFFSAPSCMFSQLVFW